MSIHVVNFYSCLQVTFLLSDFEDGKNNNKELHGKHRKLSSKRNK